MGGALEGAGAVLGSALATPVGALFGANAVVTGNPPIHQSAHTAGTSIRAARTGGGGGIGGGGGGVGSAAGSGSAGGLAGAGGAVGGGGAPPGFFRRVGRRAGDWTVRVVGALGRPLARLVGSRVSDRAKGAVADKLGAF